VEVLDGATLCNECLELAGGIVDVSHRLISVSRCAHHVLARLGHSALNLPHNIGELVTGGFEVGSQGLEVGKAVAHMGQSAAQLGLGH
jgi:hypothetical protein